MREGEEGRARGECGVGLVGSGARVQHTACARRPDSLQARRVSRLHERRRRPSAAPTARSRRITTATRPRRSARCSSPQAFVRPFGSSCPRSQRPCPSRACTDSLSPLARATRPPRPYLLVLSRKAVKNRGSAVQRSTLVYGLCACLRKGWEEREPGRQRAAVAKPSRRASGRALSQSCSARHEGSSVSSVRQVESSDDADTRGRGRTFCRILGPNAKRTHGVAARTRATQPARNDAHCAQRRRRRARGERGKRDSEEASADLARDARGRSEREESARRT